LKLLKLKGTRTELEIREGLLKSHQSLFHDERSSRLLSILKTFFPEMKTAYIIYWTPEQGEDIFSLLINNDKIASIEIDRYDPSIEPIVESEPLNNIYIKGLRKIPQITLAIALELANLDLKTEKVH